MSLLGGRLCEVICIHVSIPYFPLLIFLPNEGRGHGPLYPLAMPVPVVQPGFVNLGSKRGSEAAERGEGGVSPPMIGRFVSKLCEVAYIFFYTDPLLSLLKTYFTPIKGEHGPPGGGGERGREATERGEGVGGGKPKIRVRKLNFLAH